MVKKIGNNILGSIMLVGVSGLLIVSGVNATERTREHDRFNWTSNVWIQPQWRASWGYGWQQGYRDPWRLGIGFSTGYPYWNRHYRPYWNDSWRYPYRYERRQYVQPKPKLVAPPEVITTGVQISHAIKTLPANARVKQKNGRTVYEWQGVEYVYDWSTESYKIIE